MQKLELSTPVDIYIRDISAIPLLSPKEEKKLAKLVEEGDLEARDKLASANLRLVVKIAKLYSGRGISLQDLINEGNLGLMHAVEKFDLSKGCKFSTYATCWIHQGMLKAITNTSRSIRLPSYVNEMMVKWRKTRDKLEKELGRLPNSEEIRLKLRISVKKARIIQHALGIRYSGSIKNSTNYESPDFMLVQEDLDRLNYALKQLTPRECMVVKMRFGIGEDLRTLAYISKQFGVTREAIRCIEMKAIKKLRDLMK